MQSYVQMKLSIGKLQQVTVVPTKKQWEVVEIQLAFRQSRSQRSVDARPPLFQCRVVDLTRKARSRLWGVHLIQVDAEMQGSDVTS